MPSLNLAELANLSAVCQRLKKRVVEGQKIPSWYLTASSEAREQELKGEEIRCAFCTGRIHLQKESEDGRAVMMIHEDREDSTHCVVGIYYDGGQHKTSLHPVGSPFHEDQEERSALTEERLRRFPDSK